MAQTNVQAFSGDVEIANTLTVSDDIIVDDGTNHSLTIDASRGVVLDAKVNVLRYAETKATGLGEVALDKLVLFNL